MIPALRTLLPTRVALGLASLVGATSALAGSLQLPASSRPAFNIPDASNNLWTTTALLSVGDAAQNGYRMVGIPDGTGAYDNGDGTFTLLVNHELGNNAGIARAHGGRGAFVSKWVIRKSDLSIVSGDDLIKRVKSWNAAAADWVDATGAALAFARFCSADLPPVSAFYNAATGRGTQARIFMNGEESGSEGRGMAHIATGSDAGTSYELPATGKFSWENSLAAPFAQDKTIVVGTDDGTGGQVYIYIGQKQNSGNDIVRAGLVGGTLYGVKLEGLPQAEPQRAFSKAERTGAFTLVSEGDVTLKTGLELDAQSTTRGVTSFNRPEDGHWNPANPSEFYFLTTASMTTPSRLWVLRFKDIQNPEAGGTYEMLWDGHNDGDGSIRMMDNMTVSATGQVLIQEDPGNQSYLARLHTYDIAKKTMRAVAVHHPDMFTTGRPGFITQDEESSGIIDVSDILGRPDSYIYVDQIHAAPATNAAEFVEQGQIGLLSPSSRATNVSSRGRVTASDPMIAGFVIGGTEPKTVLVRALGPTLSAFGLTGVVANPAVQLMRDGQPVAENSNWRFNQNSAGITATGLAPTNAVEPALLLSLPPGTYTATVRDEANGAGVALVEVYEFDLQPGHTNGRVVNLSTRTSIGTGEGILISGFAIEGREPKKVLLRALGPTLTGFGVAGAIADPRLTLYRGTQSLGSNDEWSQNAAAVTELNTRTHLRPGSTVEAAMVVTLDPGIYTVTVDGANAGTGTGLLDVTEL